MKLRAKINKQQRVVEKTPKHIFYLDKINKFYKGKVKFIHIVRDPRAVIVSKYLIIKNIGFQIQDG